MIELTNVSLSADTPQGKVGIYGDSSLARLSLRADDGQLTVVTSENASVSTIVVRAMMGLWPLDEGFAAIDGELLSPATRTVFNNRISYVPRDVTIEGVTLSQIVASINGNSRAGESKSEMRRTLDELDYLHIDHKIMAVDFKNITIPMRRLLMVAAAIATERPIIVADSPTDGASDEHRQLIINRLKELASQGLTVIVASQDSQIISAANRVIEPYTVMMK